MKFWIFMLVMDLLIPISMIVYGGIYSKKPPKNINLARGYRTRMSMQNMDTYKFAQRYFGRLSYIYGLVMILITPLISTISYGKEKDFVGFLGGAIAFAQMIIMMVLIYFTEKELRKYFDVNGNRIR